MRFECCSSIRARRRRYASAVVALLGLSTAMATVARDIGDAELANEADGSQWLGYGRTYSEQRFSPLATINAGNVRAMGVDWSLDLAEDVGLPGTPMVADGVLYFTNSANIVRAVDATSGKLLWTYDPRIQEVAGPRMTRAYVHGGRGLALWKDKAYVATADGRLIAIDRTSGKEIWSVQTFDPEESRYITGAPKALHGKILVGNAGSEMGRTRGYITAYDADTGKQAWRFFIVPGDPAKGFENKAMEMAAKTWTGQWWRSGGGGHAWSEGFTYDPDFNAIYLGTGNGTPWNPHLRSPGGGDNLFLSSIVAVDADTGEYRWHYQTTPGEAWDYDATSSMVLADLKIRGKKVKALLQAPKNGFFYVIDRANGQLISAQPYATVTWASKVDLKTGRPVLAPGALYDEGKDATVAPGDWGAHSWQPMSFNPRTGLAYIPTFHEFNRFTTQGLELEVWKNPPEASENNVWGSGVEAIPAGSSRKDGVRGTLQAWDPVKQRRVWEVKQPGGWSPGTLTTAGNLVLQGRTDGKFLAYDARTGKVLWQYDLGLGIAASPITYEIKGRQYIALLVGWGSGWAAARTDEPPMMGWAYGMHMRRLVVFSLEGTAQLTPQPPPHVVTPLIAGDFKVDRTLAARGGELFGQCTLCHGGGAISGGLAPDLRASALVLSAGAFAAVVRDGIKRSRRMPSFTALTDEELLQLRHYIRMRAEADLSAGE